MTIPCIKIPIKLAINIMQQIKTHYKQVENPSGITSMHTLLEPNTVSENFRKTELLAAIFEILEQLQPVAWHQEKIDAGVEGL